MNTPTKYRKEPVAVEPVVTAWCPWADCPHGERCVHAKETPDA